MAASRPLKSTSASHPAARRPARRSAGDIPIAIAETALRVAQEFMSEQLQERPLGSVGVAALVGYAIGRGIDWKAARTAVQTVSRFTTTLLASEFGKQLTRALAEAEKGTSSALRSAHNSSRR